MNMIISSMDKNNIYNFDQYDDSFENENEET
jgi:hypothetical protein